MRGQASVGLPETGVCDEHTWNQLLGAETVQMRVIEAAALVSSCILCVLHKPSAGWPPLTGQLTMLQQPGQTSVEDGSMQELLDSGNRKLSDLSSGQEMSSNGTPPSPSSSAQTKQQSRAPANNGSSSAKGQAGRLKTWPILREGEGGAEVT